MSCKYCDNEYYVEQVLIRNEFADDNFCEFMKNNECNGCVGCSEDKNYFEVCYYPDFIVLTHWREIEFRNGSMTVISAQNSERINRRYCHNCGRKLVE